MAILLVQHGLAKSKEEDPDRSLNEQGILETRKAAAWLGIQTMDLVQIRHSGKKRAAQTAEIFAEQTSLGQGVTPVPGLNPKDDVQAYASQLQGQDGNIMLVGHLPFLDKLAAFLVTGRQEQSIVRFVNSGVVCLEEQQAQWSVIWAVVPQILPEAS